VLIARDLAGGSGSLPIQDVVVPDRLGVAGLAEYTSVFS